MYEIDKNDSVAELTGIRAPDSGAPLPVVLADESDVLLAYIVHEANPNWDGTSAVSVGHASGNRLIATVRFRSAVAHMFGPPNDESFSGHPLYGRGLKPYSATEVKSSSWIRRLERMNAVHPSHSPAHYVRYRHFIFAFKDSTFECIADEFTVAYTRGSMREVVEQIAKHFAEGAA